MSVIFIIQLNLCHSLLIFILISISTSECPGSYSIIGFLVNESKGLEHILCLFPVALALS